MQDANSRHIWYFAALVIYVIIAFLPLFFLDYTRIYPLIRENGPYQTYTAVAFLVASIFLFAAYFQPNNGNKLGRLSTRRNLFVFLLALVLFIGAGEELSWGQHILGFETPESVAKHNLQGELNLHNLNPFAGREVDGSPKTGLARWLTIGRMFSLFWAGFCVAIPLINLVSSAARQFLATLNFPIVPLWIGMAFPVNYLMSKYVAAMRDISGHYIVEIKESGFALLFMLFAITYFFHIKRKLRSEG